MTYKVLGIDLGGNIQQARSIKEVLALTFQGIGIIANLIYQYLIACLIVFAGKKLRKK